MLPSHLKAELFRHYPPEARELARRSVGSLRQLPLSFVPLLLREIIV